MRFDRLLECIESIMDLRDTHNNNFEILIKVDFDDKETIQNLGKFLKYQKYLSFIVSDRMEHGWENMRDYINMLMHYSRGKYILPINDDIVFLTKNWNTILENEAAEKKMYFIKNNGGKESFFYIPKEFYNVLDGDICPHNQIDTYLRNIAFSLGIAVYFESIEIQHYSPEYASFGPAPRDPEIFKDSSWEEKNSRSIENIRQGKLDETLEQLAIDVGKINRFLQQRTLFRQRGLK